MMDTRAKRFRDNLEFFTYFNRILAANAEAAFSFYKLLVNDPAEIKFLNDCRDFVIGNLGEIVRGMELSRALDDAAKKYKIEQPIFATNLDKVLRVGDEIKAIFEIKFSTNEKDLLIKYNHYKTLKLISQKLGVPVYILVKSKGYWHVKPISEIYEFSKNGDYWNKRLKLAEMEKMGYEEFLEFLAGVMQ